MKSIITEVQEFLPKYRSTLIEQGMLLHLYESYAALDEECPPGDVLSAATNELILAGLIPADETTSYCSCAQAYLQRAMLMADDCCSKCTAAWVCLDAAKREKSLNEAEVTTFLALIETMYKADLHSQALEFLAATYPPELPDRALRLSSHDKHWRKIDESVIQALLAHGHDDYALRIATRFHEERGQPMVMIYYLKAKGDRNQLELMLSDLVEACDYDEVNEIVQYLLTEP